MSKKECPACALEADKDDAVCPFCGYEFAVTGRSNLRFRLVALILILIFVATYILL